MTPILYTIGKGSTWNNNELRFSLRSMEMHYGKADVIIVGHLPEWCKNVHHIPMQDTPRRNYNIFAKTAKGFEVASEFIQCSDDHYMLADTDFATYYSNGLLKEKKYPGAYGQITAHTAASFPDGKYYNLHVPMRMNADRFEPLNYLPWERREFLTKSAYAYGLPSVEMDDCKLRGHVRSFSIDAFTRDRKFLSSSSIVPHDLRVWLDKRFPHKSIYE